MLLQLSQNQSRHCSDRHLMNKDLVKLALNYKLSVLHNRSIYSVVYTFIEYKSITLFEFIEST